MKTDNDDDDGVPLIKYPPLRSARVQKLKNKNYIK